MEIDNLAICFCMLCVYACCLCTTMWLSNPGQLQDAAGNQDARGGHQIGDAPLTMCVTY
jgi:hypothetical protein